MKKAAIWVVAIIIIVIGGFAIFHKSSKPSTTATNTSNGSSATKNTTTPTSSTPSAVVITKTDPTVGQYLADPSGRALYTFGGDTSGVSNCTGSCLAAWPAYQATGSTANLPAGISTIKRTDNGQTQYTLNGKPLYFFASDSNGQVTGNGVNNFQVAKPSTSSGSGNSSSPSSPY